MIRGVRRMEDLSVGIIEARRSRWQGEHHVRPGGAPARRHRGLVGLRLEDHHVMRHGQRMMYVHRHRRGLHVNGERDPKWLHGGR